MTMETDASDLFTGRTCGVVAVSCLMDSLSGVAMRSCAGGIAEERNFGEDTAVPPLPLRCRRCRKRPVPVSKDGRRRLMWSLEHVVFRVPRVTPTISAISAGLVPRSTRLMI
jgi:hypothetical protein